MSRLAPTMPALLASLGNTLLSYLHTVYCRMPLSVTEIEIGDFILDLLNERDLVLRASFFVSRQSSVVYQIKRHGYRRG